MSQVQPNSRPLVYKLIEQVTAQITPLASSTAEIYLALGRQGLDTPKMFKRIVDNAKAAKPYQPENPSFVSEPLPGMSIVVGHGPWLEALAVLAAQRQMSRQELEILADHANDPSIHDEVIHGLAHQSGFLNQDCWKTRCAAQFQPYENNGARRDLIADVLAEKLVALSRIDFEVALQHLRQEREAENEPEIRIALGRTRINAQLARVRTVPVGNALFE